MEIFIATLLLVVGGLTLWLWPSKTGEEPTFVTVYITGDPAKIALIKSLLKDSEIPFSIKGEGVQDLFGMGRLGAGYNMITGPIQVQVLREQETEARNLLSEID